MSKSVINNRFNYFKCLNCKFKSKMYTSDPCIKCIDKLNNPFYEPEPKKKPRPLQEPNLPFKTSLNQSEVIHL